MEDLETTGCAAAPADEHLWPVAAPYTPAVMFGLIVGVLCLAVGTALLMLSQLGPEHMRSASGPGSGAVRLGGLGQLMMGGCFITGNVEDLVPATWHDWLVPLSVTFAIFAMGVFALALRAQLQR